MKLKKITFCVSPFYHKHIKAMAKRRGISMGRMMFMAISAFAKMEAK